MKQVGNLFFVKQEFSWHHGFVIKLIAVGILLDGGIVEPCLPVFDPDIGIADLHMAGSDGFDLGALENDPGLHGFQDRVVVAGLFVDNDVLGFCGLAHGAHSIKKPEGAAFRLWAGQARGL